MDHPECAVIESEEWDKVQEILAKFISVHGEADFFFLLTPMLICGECGSNMMEKTRWFSSEEYSATYSCGNKKCKVSVRAETLHRLVLERITEQLLLLLKTHRKQMYNSFQRKQRRKLNSALDRARGKLTKLEDVFIQSVESQKFSIKDLPPELFEIQKDMGDARIEVIDLESQITELKALPHIYEEREIRLQNLLSRLTELPDERKQLLLDDILKEIQVFKGGNYKLMLKMPFRINEEGMAVDENG